MNYIYTYHSPLVYEKYRDACDNLAKMGINVLDAMYSILNGIHSRNNVYFKGAWLCDVSYDFPFEDDPDTEVTVESWLDYLTHYYEIMSDILTLFVPPLPHTPSQIVIAEQGFDKLVISYVP